ncbi:DUF4097 family beta strand repeat-containing protein [Streptomyces sp. NBC_01433]|uniref:DUF4097 family beta strand repeat-containing protein n=1 Tax=Streptomyces sp. NBC_01433 TaxID=2903864 RepID=UPI002255FFBA|nr:DUF4097 family beta strand repeat-containing protein [Streptomyces sp. NBC_01433]MCX4682642.1 DUF4097 family beta strand repeat-containing protein [Streptomyces sp. NBC_01433]MCX4682682.1 DUF4097 family beta strand repeat-containing protein [Streptomyces sp. NBC_01433]
MTTRKIAAETTGPVTIDASLLGNGGAISVQAIADCERATLTISTTDEDGPAATAVREAMLRQSATGLNVSVTGQGGSNCGSTIITGGGVTVVQHSGNFQGGVINGGFFSGDVYMNGVKVSGQAMVVTGTAPIKITAIVPPGSKVIGRTDSADIEAIGTFALVSGHTQSGDLRVDDAEKVTASTKSGSVTVNKASDISAKTMSGGVYLNITDVVDASTMSGSIDIQDFAGTARLKTMSGSIRAHATAGGDIDAKTMSGSINITATAAALDERLDIRPRSMSGSINVPSRRIPDSGPRRRR